MLAFVLKFVKVTINGISPLCGLAVNCATGIGNPVMNTVAVPEHPFASVPVTVYVNVPFTVNDCPSTIPLSQT